MLNFLHTFHPSPILAAIGSVQIHWYGFFIVMGALAAISVSVILAKQYSIKPDTIFDLAFWLIINGIVGARLYHIALEWPYYLSQPLSIFKIWQGGLAIHGGIIAGLITLWYYGKKHQLNFWQLASIITPGIALAQALGRWGNYFNQELFGYPTGLAWGIPIDPAHRPWQYLNYEYFHPTFLYESIGNLLIFIILIFLHYKKVTTRLPDGQGYELRVMSYLFMYSVLRFSTEFIRIDPTPAVLGLRFPQLVSLIAVFLSLSYFSYFIWLKIKKRAALDK